MTKLEELIEKLCPDGVEYKELSEVLTIKNGKDYKHFGEGNVPVYGSGGIMTYIDTAVYEKPSVLIPRKGSLDKLYFVQEPFWTVDTIFYTDINADIVEPKYIFYYLQKEHLEKLNKAGGVPSLTQSVLNKVKLPVPPLEVQREIVRILDNFTFLTAELAAELAARQKQYEYYRDLLLTFKSNESTILNELEINAPVRWMKLGDIADIKRGIRVVKKQLITEGKYPVYQNSLEPMGYFNKYNCEAETTYVISAGAAGEIGFCNKKFWAADDCLIFIDTKNVNNKFIYYSLLVRKNILLANVRKASIPRLSRIVVENLIIPVPPLEVQQRIVDILDRFDSLCNDISDGLPAEIEARQKQYEYYRDKLLTFKELKKEA